MKSFESLSAEVYRKYVDLQDGKSVMQPASVDLGVYEQAVGHHVRGVGEVNLMCRVFGR